MKNKNNISVVIPAYNEEKDIGECLKSLHGQSYKNFEVIVVDDGSTDKTRDIAKRFKEVKLILGQHKGPGFSRNLGAKSAKGKILVFVDADMTFDKDYIKNLIKPILIDKIGNIIGTTHDYELATNTDNWISDMWGKIRVSKEESKNVKIFRAIRRDKFLKLGGFDPKYGYADDQTLWFKYAVGPIVAKDTTCYHKNPTSLDATYKQARWIGASWRGRYALFRMPLIGRIFSVLFILTIPFLALIKSIQNHRYGLLNSVKFYFYKFEGYAMGILRAIWSRKFEK